MTPHLFTGGEAEGVQAAAKYTTIPTVEATFMERKVAEVFGCSDGSFSWIKITLIMLDLDLGVVGFCMRVSLSLQDFKPVNSQSSSPRQTIKEVILQRMGVIYNKN